MTSGSIQGVSIVDRRMARLGIDLAPCSSLWSCFTSQAHFVKFALIFEQRQFEIHQDSQTISEPIVSPLYPHGTPFYMVSPSIFAAYISRLITHYKTCAADVVVPVVVPSFDLRYPQDGGLLDADAKIRTDETKERNWKSVDIPGMWLKCGLYIYTC